MVKMCVSCNKEKSLEDFHIAKSNKDKLTTSCGDCRNKKYVVRYNKEYNRDRHLQRRYGISSVNYDKLLVEQKGVCAICYRLDTSGNRLSVDHNHTNGKVRGLLCHNCNNGIGIFNENILFLTSAINYLTKYA